MSRCASCLSTLEPGWKYCIHCGTPGARAADAEPRVPLPTASPHVPPAAPPPPAGADRIPPIPSVFRPDVIAHSAGEHPRSILAIVVVAAAIAVLVVIAVALLWPR